MEREREKKNSPKIMPSDFLVFGIKLKKKVVDFEFVVVVVVVAKKNQKKSRKKNNRSTLFSSPRITRRCRPPSSFVFMFCL